MNVKQDWPGWLMCVVCGALDAACFMALGGTFVRLMTGNLILMGISFGDIGVGSASLVYLLPLVGYAAGALVVGVARPVNLSTSQLKDALWVAWLLLLIVTLTVWAANSPLVGAMRWFVVTMTALFMGFFSGTLYLFRLGQQSANVMTSTMTKFLSDIPSQLVTHHVAWSKGIAIVSFLAGATLGAWLTHTGNIQNVYAFALLLLLLAIAGEVKKSKLDSLCANHKGTAGCNG